MRYSQVLVVGGSGFIGSHVVHRLTASGRSALVPARRRDRAKHLILLPTVEVVDADVHDDAALARLVSGCDAVVNLVGILHGSKADFARAHAELPRRIVAACAAARVRRLIHVSAIGASREAPSEYLRSKAEGEAAVAAASAQGIATTIFRPSVVFGLEDRFLNLFADLARLLPVLPIGGASAKMQPVWVEDVAQAIVNALDNESTFGRCYELCGPKVYTLAQLVAFAAEASGHPRRVVALPDGVAGLQARLMELAPGEPLLSRDNLLSLKVDNIASRQPYAMAPELGIVPASLESEATAYLAGATLQARLSRFRLRAHR